MNDQMCHQWGALHAPYTHESLWGHSAIMWQLLACAKPGYTWPACRYLCCPAWQLVDCVCVSKCVCHLSNKELLYFTFILNARDLPGLVYIYRAESEKLTRLKTELVSSKSSGSITAIRGYPSDTSTANYF